MIDYAFAPIIGIAFFGIVWLLLFFHKNNLKKEMLFMSIISTPLGPISEIFYTQDYWQPQMTRVFGIGIEDILFAFFIGGISAVIYEELFIKRIRNGKRNNSLPIMIFSIIGLIIITLMTFLFKINSIYSTSVVLIFLGLLVVNKRHDLAKNAIGSGILVSLIMLIFYIFYISIFPNIIQDWWMLNNISGILVLGAPIEELLWGFAWGFFAGPIYEYWKNIKEK